MEAQAVMAGISAIGNILGGIGAFKAGRGQAKALEASARQARAEAGISAQLALEEADRAAATAAVEAGAGGAGITGSALASMDDLASSGLYNARAALYAGTVESRNRMYEAKVARKQATLTLATKWFQAAGDASSALGSMKATRDARLGSRRTSKMGPEL